MDKFIHEFDNGLTTIKLWHTENGDCIKKLIGYSKYFTHLIELNTHKILHQMK